MKAIAYINGTYVAKYKRCGYAGQIVMEDDVFNISGFSDDEKITKMQSIGAKIKASEMTIKKAIDLGIKQLEIINNLNALENFTKGYVTPKQKGTIDYMDFIDSIEGVIEIEMRRPEAEFEKDKLEDLKEAARKALNN